MDLRKVKKLIELLEDSALTEMEITEGENTIRLSRADVRQSAAATGATIVTPAATTTPTPTPAPPSVAITPAATPSPDDDAPPAGNIIKSPLVGTFYNSPSPDEKPFVSIGAEVSEGDVLCLIEAMKTFNRIEAEVAGVITTIYKNNGEPVEYGEPLFVIEDRATGGGE